MKGVYRRVLLFFLVSPMFANGQSLDSSFNFLTNQFDKKWTPGSTQLIATTYAGSNSANTGMFTDFLFRSSFSTKSKESFLNTDLSTANLQFGNEVRLEYKATKKLGLYADNHEFNSFSFSSDLGKMALFGNKRYAGQTIVSENPQVLQYATSDLGFAHNTINSNRWRIKTSAAISVLRGYSNYRASKVEIETEETGEYIDLTVQNGQWTKLTDKKQGMGVVLGAELRFMPSNTSEIYVKATGINGYFLPLGKVYNADTSFRFEGLEYTSIVDGQLNNWTTDSIVNQYINENRTAKKMVVLPSKIAFDWNQTFNQKHQIGIHIQTVGFGQFGNYASLNHDYTFSPKMRLRSTLGYGDFTNLQLNETLELSLKSVNFIATFYGLNALLLPTQSHSYGVSAGFSTLLSN